MNLNYCYYLLKYQIMLLSLISLAFVWRIFHARSRWGKSIGVFSDAQLKKSLSDSSLAPHTFFPTIHLCHPTMTTTKNHLNCSLTRPLIYIYSFFFLENTGRWNSAPVLLKCPLQIFFRWMNLDFDRSWVFKAINIFSSLQIRQEKPYYVADPEVDSLVSIFLLLSCSGWCE